MLSIELNSPFKEDLDLKWASKILWDLRDHYVDDGDKEQIVKALLAITDCSIDEAFEAVDAHAQEVFK